MLPVCYPGAAFLRGSGQAATPRWRQQERGPPQVLAFRDVDLEHLEHLLRERLDALGPAPRAELLHVLTMPDFERAGRIGEFYGNPKTRTFAELLIDCEEDKYLRTVLVGLLREG